jgi:hypothetical protein
MIAQLTMDNMTNRNSKIKTLIFGIEKERFFYYFVLSVLYLNGFEMLLRAVLRKVSPSIELFFTIILQFYIFIIPIFICWYGSSDKRFFLAIFLLFYFIMFLPLAKYGDLLSFAMGIKVYLLCFFYIPILKYLSANEKFENKFLKHFIILASFYVVWYVFEILFMQFAPGLSSLMRQFALYEEQQVAVGRPIGMSFDYQTGALMVSFLCIILFLIKRYIWSFIVLIINLSIGMRTWALATVLVLFLLFIFRLFFRAKIKYGIFLVCAMVVLSIYNYDHLDYYIKVVTLETGSGGIIIDLFKENVGYLFREGGVFPNGFIKLWSSPIIEQVTQGVPDELAIGNEVAILLVYFQMGLIGTLLWLIILYGPFFKRGSSFLANDFKVLLFLSMLGFIHHLTIVKPMFYIFLLFCGIEIDKKSRLITGQSMKRSK